MSHSQKSDMRRTLRKLRRSLDTAAVAHATSGVASILAQLPLWQHAHRVASYSSCNGEISTELINIMAHREGKQLFLPVVGSDNKLSFAVCQPEDAQQINQFGIAEPSASAERCSVDQLELILLPLVAWDRRGTRLGMGGGFYDRCLEGVSEPVRIGLAHSLQEVDHVPSEPWDIKMHYILTEQELICCQPPA